jgi:hypothetical protein
MIFPPIQSTFQPNVTLGSAGELQQGVVDMPYAIPNVRCENGPATAHVRIGWYRSVFNIPHAFAVCSFADELAALAGRDPLEYLRKLIGPQRKIDLKAQGVDYPNYGSPIELYPIDTGRLLPRTPRRHLRPAENHKGADWHRVFERQRCGCDYLAALARPARAFSQKLCCFDML